MISAIKITNIKNDEIIDKTIYLVKNGKPTKFNLLVGENGGGKTHFLENDILNRIINKDVFKNPSFVIQGNILYDPFYQRQYTNGGRVPPVWIPHIDKFLQNHPKMINVKQLKRDNIANISIKCDYVAANTIYNKEASKTNNKSFSLSPEGLEERIRDLYIRDESNAQNPDVDDKNFLNEISKITNLLLNTDKFSFSWNQHTKKLSTTYKKIKNKTVKSGTLTDMSSGELKAFALAIDMILFNDSSTQLCIIDEPESNLHPTAQLKFAEFYTASNNDNQLFIATHSPYIVQSFLEKYPNDTSIFYCSKKDDLYKVENAMGKLILEKPHFSEINYYAFNIPTIEFLDFLVAKINDEKSGTILLDETKNISSGFEKLRKEHVTGGWKHQTKVCFIRNYYHHFKADFDEHLIKNEGGVTPHKMLKDAIDECVEYIKSNEI